MRNLTYIAALLLVGGLTTACSKENPEPEGGVALEAVTTELGASATISKAIATDPTLTLPQDRYAQNHLLAIWIATPANQQAYKYDTGSAAWVPNTTGIPVYFPSYGNSTVTFEMYNTAVADPVAAQRGTAQQLLDADVLTATVASQSPVKNITGVTLTHKNALLDITVDPTLDLSLVDEIRRGTDTIAYAVPVTSGDPDNYLVVIEPGDHATTVTMTYNGIEYTCPVEAGNLTTDEFAANGRYTLTLSLLNGELVCGEVLVQPWSEAGSGSGTVDPM